MKKYFFVILLLSIAFLQNIYAQIPTSLNKLQSFAGKYQFRENRMTFLQISLKDSGLLLRQLWDNQEIYFKQTGALTFYNQERSFPLTFTKDSQGVITQVLAFNRDVWNKVPDNYQPELQKIVKLSLVQLKACEGKYQLKEGNGDADEFLQITVVEDHLLFTLPRNQQQVNFWPVSALDFFDDKQTFPIKFIKDSNGIIIQLLAKDEHIWVKVK
jgi:hypothetical protein